VSGQDVEGNQGGTIRAEDYNYFYENLNESHQLGTGNMCVCWCNDKY
jgi:hypothetical protein